MFGNPFHQPPIVHLCGLYYNTWRHGSLCKTYLPQVDVSAHATILANTSRTVLTQTFANTSTEKGIREARYIFPLYDGVSVVGFTCLVGDRTIVGEVKEKDKARADFNEAVSKGETAGLLEQLPDASDIFTTTVGNIPPRAKVVVKITYLDELKQDMEVDGIRFTIPNIICPRYGDYPLEMQSGPAVDAVGGGVSIAVDAEMADGSFIQKMLSPTHPISMSMGTTSSDPDADPTMTKASATLSLGTACLDKDFVLQVIAKNTGVPKAVVESHPTIPNHRALMATLVPKFTLPAERPEIVFVIDRSGSMGGSRIELAKQALLVFLKSLPVGVKFNICSFGSSYSFLWPKSATYNQTNLEQAVRHAEMLMADYGGTEMLRPVEVAIKNRYEDMSLEVVLLTDGEIYNQHELFSYLNSEVAEAKKPIRVFTLGIGNGVSHSLIEGVARAGNGFSQAVGEGEKMDSKVVRMLKGALSPHINDYTLEVKYAAHTTHSEDQDDFEIVEKVTDSLKVNLDLEGKEKKTEVKKPISLFDPSSNPDQEEARVNDETGESRYAHLPAIPIPKIIQAPQIIPSLFAFNRTTVYLLLGPEAPKNTPKSVILRGSSPHGPLELEIPIQVLDTPGSTIHQLAAKKAIAELEQGRGWLAEAREEHGKLLKVKCEGRFDEMVEREAVRLGVQFQVGGKWCSFVATEKNPQEREREFWEYLEDDQVETSSLFPVSGVDNMRYQLQKQQRQLQMARMQLQAPTFPKPTFQQNSSFGPRRALQSAPQQHASQQQMQQGQQPAQNMLFGATIGGGRGGGTVPSGIVGHGGACGRGGSGVKRLVPESFNHGSSPGFKPAFGSASTPAFGSQAPAGGAARNNSNAFGSSLFRGFGGNSPSNPSPAPQSGGLFGLFRSAGTAAVPQSGGLFGSLDSAKTSSLFSAPQSEGLFGTSTTSTEAVEFSPAPQPGRLFGGSSNAGTSNLFSAPQSGGSSLFSANHNIQSSPVGNPHFGAAAPAFTSTSPTSLHAILLHQTFGGAFPFSETLLRSLSVILEDFEKRIVLEGIEERDVLATGVVVAFLEEKMADEKDSWELIVDKARQWMEDRCQGVEGAEKIMAAARKLII